MKLTQRIVAIAISIAVLLLLAACASKSIQDHYYSLVLAADAKAPASQSGLHGKHLIVGPIQLPAYLDQRSLTMQMGSTQIQAANHHFWAEPLDEAISKVLVSDLSSLIDSAAVDRDSGRWTMTGDCRLRIEFDKFHATSGSRVVSSGRYWIATSESGLKREFEMSQTLSSDGYAHAVDSLRLLLNQLGSHVSQTIQEQSTCAS